MLAIPTRFKHLACLTILVCFATSSQAAIVYKTKKSKRRVTISQITPQDNFIKGEKACIYDEQNKLRACGTIVYIKKAGDKAYIKLSKKKIRRVKAGMIVVPRSQPVN